MPTWICLLRGVNLGARNKLNMAALREVLTESGLSDVRAYLQSGNVIADSPTTDPDELAGMVAHLLGERFDLAVPVIVRSPEQLRRLASWCPFRPFADENPALVHLLHLTERPDPDRVTDLCQQDWGPDKVAVERLRRGDQIRDEHASEPTVARHRPTSAGRGRNSTQLAHAASLDQDDRRRVAPQAE